MTLYTVGHSNRTLEQLIAILKAHNIDMIADVRGGRAGSRTFPHFNKENLMISLPTVGIQYKHFPDLGGRRSVNKTIDPEINKEWRVPAFKNFADYAYTSSAFDIALSDLISDGANTRVAYMCSEAVPWRCHRSLITDYLVMLHHIEITHLLGEKQTMVGKPHTFAKVVGAKIAYPVNTI